MQKYQFFCCYEVDKSCLVSRTFGDTCGFWIRVKWLIKLKNLLVLIRINMNVDDEYRINNIAVESSLWCIFVQQ